MTAFIVSSTNTHIDLTFLETQQHKKESQTKKRREKDIWLTAFLITVPWIFPKPTPRKVIDAYVYFICGINWLTQFGAISKGSRLFSDVLPNLNMINYLWFSAEFAVLFSVIISRPFGCILSSFICLWLGTNLLNNEMSSQASCCPTCLNPTRGESFTPYWRCSATGCTTSSRTTESSYWVICTAWLPCHRPTRTSCICGNVDTRLHTSHIFTLDSMSMR